MTRRKPLTLRLRFVTGLVAILAAAASALAASQQQSAGAGDPGRPAFEVAAIRQNRSADQNASVRALPGGRIVITNNTLRNIIRNAYNVQNFQIAGGPDWVSSDRWNIEAKAPGDATPPEMLAMVKTLLADRFKLVVRNETRDMPIYSLVMSRADRALGPHLRPSTVDCAAVMAAARASGGRPADRPDGRPACGTRIRPGALMTTSVTLADMARNLAPFTGRTVVDKTGLAGSFDIDLTWTPEPLGPAPDAPPPADDGASLFTAVREQLGLKLEPQRGPVDVLVIDSAARPLED